MLNRIALLASVTAACSACGSSSLDSSLKITKGSNAANATSMLNVTVGIEPDDSFLANGVNGFTLSVGCTNVSPFQATGSFSLPEGAAGCSARLLDLKLGSAVYQPKPDAGFATYAAGEKAIFTSSSDPDHRLDVLVYKQLLPLNTTGSSVVYRFSHVSIHDRTQNILQSGVQAVGSSPPIFNFTHVIEETNRLFVTAQCNETILGSSLATARCGTQELAAMEIGLNGLNTKLPSTQDLSSISFKSLAAAGATFLPAGSSEASRGGFLVELSKPTIGTGQFAFLALRFDKSYLYSFLQLNNETQAPIPNPGTTTPAPSTPAPSTPAVYNPLRTFYVATTGSDSSNGSSAAPWKTLQKAASNVKAGDMVVVKAGTYAGFQIMTKGTVQNPIIFKAEPNVLIDNKLASASAYSGAINMEGADYIIIDGFSIKMATYGSIRTAIRTVENTGVVIRNNKIDDSSWWGILTGNSSNLLIENNLITNTKIQHGIYVANSADNPIIRNNRVENSRGAGIQINADKDLPGDGIISGALVENNILLNNCSGESSSLNLNGVEDSIVRNNVIVSQYRNGIAMYQDNQTAGTKNNLVVNNTIVGVGWYAISISGTSTGNELRNNILMSIGWSSSYRGGLGVETAAQVGLKSDNNILLGRVNTDPGDSESTSLSFAQWKAKGFDTNSIHLEGRYGTAAEAVSALFVSTSSASTPQNGDYHLKAGSPAVDAATVVNGVTADVEGLARPQGARPDIGAYERAAN